MKGATPCGAERVDQHQARPRPPPPARAPAAGRSRASRPVSAPGRTYCAPMPTTIASTTEVVTSGEGCPHAVKSRSITAPARAKESARKKIQREADDVERQDAAEPLRGGATSGRQPSARSTASPTPWIPPQIDERPGGAVPEPAEQHRQQQVAVREQRALAVAAERDVEVVAQPARQRHVPAPPEVLQRDGGVRRVEVLRELEAEQQRDADRDVRVAAEVGEDLDRVAVDADQHLERRVPVRRGEDVVDDVRREVVRDHDLQEEPADDQEERARDVDPPRVARRLELRQQLARADDRAGDEMREERLEDREAREATPARARRGRCRRRTRSP